MPPILHWFPASPPCWAVQLTAKMLGIHLELKRVDMENGEHRSQEFMKMNPASTVPTLEDGQTYVWESRAIMTYLSEKYGKNDSLYPKDLKQRTAVDTMLYFDIGSLFKTLVAYYYPPAFDNQAEDQRQLVMIHKRMAAFNEILSQRPYVSGNHITLADLTIVCSLAVAEEFQFSLDPYPEIRKWFNRVRLELGYHDEIIKEGIRQFSSLRKNHRNPPRL